MGWLLDNALATMPGPAFLLFYGLVAAIAIVGAWLFVDAQDRTDRVPPPRAAGVVDPYELAYLRGGAAEVLRTAIYALRQQRLVELSGGGRVRTSGGFVAGLNPIERRVHEAIAPEPTIASLFAQDGLLAAVEDLCRATRQRLAAQQLLRPPEVARAAVFAIAAGLGLLGALAGYKLLAAAAHGRSNVGLLIAEAFIAGLLIVVVVRKADRDGASKRGRAYLAQIRLAYSGKTVAALSQGVGQAAGGAAALLMVGLFGYAALKGTPDEALAREFARARASGGDSGGGCGGGDGGGGGGCGGCGGGD
jgi:uncharacterized protein (TIGR04222 family)